MAVCATAFLVAFVAATIAGLGFGRRLMRVAAGHVRRRGRNLRDVVIVGDGGPALDTATRLARREALGYRVVDVLTLELAASKIAREASAAAIVGRLAAILDEQPVDEVFVAFSLEEAQPLIRPVIALCEELGVPCASSRSSRRSTGRGRRSTRSPDSPCSRSRARRRRACGSSPSA